MIRHIRRFCGLSHGNQIGKSADSAVQPRLENLEPRVLFSVAPVEAPADSEADPQAAEESVVVSAQAARETAATLESAESTQESLAAESTVSGQSAVPADQEVNLVNLNPGVEEVHRETLEAVAEAAAERWRATGLTAEQSAALDRIEYVVEDLGGTHLGFAEGNRITLDDNAAGNLWFIDPTPLADEEYTADSGTLYSANSGTFAWGKTDLLTVILHEQGNILGLEDVESDTGNVMLGVLGYNDRVLPAEGQAEGAVLGAVESSYLESGVTGSGDNLDVRQPFLGVNYAIITDGIFPNEDSPSIDDPFLGEIKMFGGNFAPEGSLLAQGQLLPIAQNSALFSILGTIYGGNGETDFALPDLRGRAPIGAGNGPGIDSVALGEKSGGDINLNVNQLPSHGHTGLENSGGGQAHSIEMPTLGLNYVISTQGIYGSTLGEIKLFAGNFATAGRFADGQLLPIAQNTALFSLLGTTYGGDGESTFALPDLRGRIAVNDGTGPNLSTYQVGAPSGQNTNTLTTANLPSHHHTLPAGGDSDDTGAWQSLDIIQPTLAIDFRVDTLGVFPGGFGSEPDGTIGAIRMGGREGVFTGAGNTSVRDADGELLAIAQNSALFSIFGTTYGGDGETTFGLPDLRGRAAVGTGTGPNLNPVSLGQKGGLETTTLTVAQMAAHSHVVSAPTDSTAPTVTSILRQTPADATTNANSVTFRVTFDEDVQNVDVADFTLSGTAAGDGTIGAPSAVTGTSVYDVTITGLTSSNGTINLDFAGAQNIEDLAGNALANTTPGSEEDYTLDNTAPAVTAFARNNPATSPTNSDTLVFDITFDETVTNVDAADFDITGTTAGGVLAGSGAAYTLTLSGGDLAGLNGSVGLNLAAGQNIADTAGNALGAGEPATDETYTLDNVAPTLTAFARNNPSGEDTNADTLVFDISFDEAVTNVDATDFDITGTTATGVLAGSGAAYTLSLSGGDLAGLNGAVGLNLAGGQNIADTAGNALGAGEPATDETFALDNSAPALTAFARNNPATSATNSDTLVFDITFDEPVTNVDAADFNITGTTATGVLAGSGAAYTLTLSGGDLAGLNGAVGLNLAGGQNIADTAGNALGAGEPATDETFALDNSAPALTAFARNNPATSPTNSDTLVFDISFDETVTNVDAADFDITGTTATGVLAGSGAAYTLTLSGGDLAGLNGAVGLNLAAGQNIADTAGNALGAGEPATDETYLLDNTGPTPSITGPASPTNSDPFNVTIDFGEAVNDFVQGDVTVTNGSVSNFTDNTDGTFTVGIDATADGAVSVSVAASVATDLAGNNNSASNTYNVTVDTTAPTLTAFARNTPAGENTNADTLVFDITFDGAVTNVDATDFSVTGTTAIGVLAGSGSAYTLTLSGGDLAGLNGTVGLNLAGGQNIEDAVGNALGAGEPATDETYTLDNVAPTLTAFARNNPSGENTNADTLVFDITFDGAVTNVDATDFSVTGTTASGVLAGSGSAYTLTLSGGDLAGSNGTVGLNLAGGQNIEDAVGNALGAGEPATDETYTLDNVAPTLTAFARNNPSGENTNADTLVFDITFDGAVTNVDATDFSVTGTTASGVLAGSGSAYTLTLSGGDLAGSNGTVGLNLAGGQNIEDAVGNALGAGEPATDETYTLDNVAPTLTAFARNNPSGENTNADTLVFDITFDGAVTNVDATDFSVTGTTASGVLAGSGSAYTLTLSGGDLAGSNGTVGLNLAGGQDIEDAVGNALGAGEPATDETYTLDNIGPTPTLSGPAGPLTNLNPFDVTVNFGETVTTFIQGEVTVSNGSVTGFTDNTGGNFTVEITPVAGGNVTVDVAAGVADDSAGNGNNAATQYSVTQNSAPAQSVNTGLTVDQGSTGNVIDESALAFSDVEQAATAIIYTLDTLPTRGTLHLSGGAALTLGATFTQDDLDNDRVTYDHTAGDDTDDTFRVDVSDGAGGAVADVDFAITVEAVAATTVNVGGPDPLRPDITLTDTGAVDNNITIILVGDKIRITDPAGISGGAGTTQIDAFTIEIDVNAANLNSVRVNGGDGDDTLTIDFSGGSNVVPGATPAAGRGLIFDGGGGEDTIVVNGVTGNPIRTSTTDNGGSTLSALVTGGRWIGYTDVENNTVDLRGSTADDLVIYIDDPIPGGDPAPDSVSGPITTTLRNYTGPGPNAGVSELTFSNGLVNILFNTPTNSLIINGDDDDGDIFNILGMDSSWDANLIINGLGGQDTVVQSGDVSVTGSGAVTYNVEAIELESGASITTDTGNITLAGTGGTGNLTGVALRGAEISSTSGNVGVTGSGGTTGNFNRGVLLDVGAGIASSISTGGSISLDGTGGSGGLYGAGVTLIGSTVESTGAGPVTITGTGGAGTLFSEGVSIHKGSTVDAGTGNLTISGSGGSAGTLNRGVSGGLSELKSNGGNIVINGTGGGTGIFGVGVDLTVTEVETTGTGTVTIRGTGASGSVGNMGVKLSNSSSVSAVDGEIQVFGTGNGSSLLNHGIQLTAGTSIGATGNGAVTLTGTGGAGTTLNNGVDVSGPASLSVADGDLAITGSARGTASMNRGIQLIHGTLTATGSGNIGLTGIGSQSANGVFNTGINMAGGGIQTVGGNITLNGAGGTGSTYNEGIRIAGATLRSTVGGSLSLTGTANAATGGVFNSGVSLLGVTLDSSGSVEVIGTGGGGTLFNHGIFMQSISAPSSTPTADGDNGTGLYSEDEKGNFFLG